MHFLIDTDFFVDIDSPDFGALLSTPYNDVGSDDDDKFITFIDPTQMKIFLSLACSSFLTIDRKGTLIDALCTKRIISKHNNQWNSESMLCC